VATGGTAANGGGSTPNDDPANAATQPSAAAGRVKNRVASNKARAGPQPGKTRVNICRLILTPYPSGAANRREGNILSDKFRDRRLGNHTRCSQVQVLITEPTRGRVAPRGEGRTDVRGETVRVTATIVPTMKPLSGPVVTLRLNGEV